MFTDGNSYIDEVCQSLGLAGRLLIAVEVLNIHYVHRRKPMLLFDMFQ